MEFILLFFFLPTSDQLQIKRQDCLASAEDIFFLFPLKNELHQLSVIFCQDRGSSEECSKVVPELRFSHRRERHTAGAFSPSISLSFLGSLSPIWTSVSDLPPVVLWRFMVMKVREVVRQSSSKVVVVQVNDKGSLWGCSRSWTDGWVRLKVLKRSSTLYIRRNTHPVLAVWP